MNFFIIKCDQSKNLLFFKFQGIEEFIAKMYSVHVTPGRSTERKKNSDDMDNEIRTYKGRRKESISVKLKNYIRSQFQPDTISGESEKSLAC